jgi:hypothetical protein
LRKFCPFRCRKPPGHQTDLAKIEPPIAYYYTCTKNRERILKAIREKKQITFRVKSIKFTVDFSRDIIRRKA